MLPPSRKRPYHMTNRIQRPSQPRRPEKSKVLENRAELISLLASKCCSQNCVKALDKPTEIEKLYQFRLRLADMGEPEVLNELISQLNGFRSTGQDDLFVCQHPVCKPTFLAIWGISIRKYRAAMKIVEQDGLQNAISTATRVAPVEEFTRSFLTHFFAEEAQTMANSRGICIFPFYVSRKFVLARLQESYAEKNPNAQPNTPSKSTLSKVWKHYFRSVKPRVAKEYGSCGT